MLLKNKNTVITGCNKGIGKEISKFFFKTKFCCVRSIDEILKTVKN